MTIACSTWCRMRRFGAKSFTTSRGKTGQTKPVSTSSARTGTMEHTTSPLIEGFLLVTCHSPLKTCSSSQKPFFFISPCYD
ncbi:hypothetical protein PR08_gp51 [Idiomarinaceae phage Phi1M2-2]|uniref:hypothetical protein n=1 Tax=Idiomarinaceae phage Phi1M2-2 TaxID=1527515 RepID=UPI0004F7FF53|nr:hypothetical protein PR08_gp51 [Idiomarinaceae phage Phi1M2-2]AIM40808.1 hypothetical protein M22_051 [Idiomarinaceae phage Phi1M2-2]